MKNKLGNTCADNTEKWELDIIYADAPSCSEKSQSQPSDPQVPTLPCPVTAPTTSVPPAALPTTTAPLVGEVHLDFRALALLISAAWKTYSIHLHHTVLIPWGLCLNITSLGRLPSSLGNMGTGPSLFPDSLVSTTIITLWHTLFVACLSDDCLSPSVHCSFPLPTPHTHQPKTVGGML